MGTLSTRIDMTHADTRLVTTPKAQRLRRSCQGMHSTGAQVCSSRGCTQEIHPYLDVLGTFVIMQLWHRPIVPDALFGTGGGPCTLPPNAEGDIRTCVYLVHCNTVHITRGALPVTAPHLPTLAARADRGICFILDRSAAWCLSTAVHPERGLHPNTQSKLGYAHSARTCPALGAVVKSFCWACPGVQVSRCPHYRSFRARATSQRVM